MSVSTDSYSFGTVDQVAHNLVVTLNGSFSTGGLAYERVYFQWTPSGGSSDFGPVLNSGLIGYFEDISTSGSYSFDVGRVQVGINTNTKMVADKTHSFFAVSDRYNKSDNSFINEITGSTLTFKTNAVTATASTPSSSSITASTATIACNFFPNTNESTATVWLEYRVFGASSWTTAGVTASYSGYSTQSISRNLTGLAGSTTYEYRLNLTRTTNDGTTLQSSIATFTTAAAAPTVTSDGASSVSSSAATLNGTVTPNSLSTTYKFEWGLTTAYGTSTSAQGPSSSSSSVPYSGNISGLTSSTTYHYRSTATYSGGTVTGADSTFTTAVDPSVDAANEAHMHLPQYDGTYGVATTIYFTLSSPAATSSDRLVTTAPGSLFAAGDIKISKDGGALANVANSVTQITAANPTYSLVLSATEMQAEVAIVQFVDLDGPLFRDLYILVRTKERLGQSIIDATQIGSNTPAITATGVGTSPGILATGGATSAGDITGVLSSHVIRKSTAQAGAASTITLDASASATDSYYNNSVIMITSGTGVGQFRTIASYVGSTKVATVNRSWSVNPGASSVFVILPADDVWNISPGVELAAIPTATSSFGSMLQATWQRFFYKRTQTVSTQTLFRSDSSTTLGSASVADDGSVQTSSKIS